MSSQTKALLVISASADHRLREEVAAGLRPRTEYLELERRHGMTLLDWSQLHARAAGRSMLPMVHARAALQRLRDHDVLFSDGERVGIPLALALQVRDPHPHVMIGHRLTAPKKRVFFRTLRAHRRMTRIIVHTRTQLEAACRQLRVPPENLQLMAYGVDTRYWRPAGAEEERTIVSAGREHRDYALLDQACKGLPVTLLITAASLHSPGARCTLPEPGSQAVVRRLSYIGLRESYEKASIIVVPLLPNDFGAGLTSVLEGMAMGKAVIVTATDGLAGLVIDGETGWVVPPGDEQALRSALLFLASHPTERKRLGANARAAVEEQYGLDRFVDSLATSISTATVGVETVLASASSR